MAYYNSPYMGQQYNAYSAPNYYQPTYQQQPFQQAMQPQYSMINGKIVDGIDVVRGTEIPIGSYGVFPKADMSGIFVKNWTSDGKTEIIEFSRKQPEVETRDDSYSAMFNDINSSLEKINKKIDALKTASFAASRNRKKDDACDE